MQTGKFLIPRPQQPKFCLQFTSMSILGWVVGGISSIGLERSLLGVLAPVDSWPWVKVLANILFAVVFATDQALVLRQYIAGRLWMLATSIGWLIAYSVGTAWVKYISSVASSSDQGLSSELALMWGLLSTILYILSGVWLGLCQWLVLRRYAKQVWWWNFLPSVCLLLISFFLWLLSLIENLIPNVHRIAVLYWGGQGLTAVVLGVIPAIGLCTLKKKSHSGSKGSSSLLLTK